MVGSHRGSGTKYKLRKLGGRLNNYFWLHLPFSPQHRMSCRMFMDHSGQYGIIATQYLANRWACELLRAEYAIFILTFMMTSMLLF